MSSAQKSNTPGTQPENISKSSSEGVVEDNDYTLSRVPAHAKKPFWKILLIRIGSICCVSQLVLGAALGYGMTFWGAFWATMLGSVLLEIISWALGTAAAREGLSTSLLSRWTGFGKMGSAIFGGVMAISMVGWFGVQNSVFGNGLSSIIPFTDFLGKFETPGWSIVTGLAITLLVVFGVNAIADFATVLVPLFIIVVLYASFHVFQSTPFMTLFTSPAPGPALSLGAATTMVTGGFIAGAIATPDYGRYLKNGKQVFWMTLIGTFVGELGMNLLAVLLAHATGTNNVVDMMMKTSGIVGVIIVITSTVKLNDINLYSSSLGLSTMINAVFNRKLNRNVLVWSLGIVGTFLSVIGILKYFTNFLTLLGVAVPPVAGIMVIDYYILRRQGRKDLEATRASGTLPSSVEKWNPVSLIVWVLGFAIGEITSIYSIGIPGLNSLIISALLYWVVMEIMAKVKGVKTIEFAHTSQVL
ncbi:cytosine permease [Bifidobacterium sp. ESL0690]|uniref:purine-cytosine permease family protein n=1 Tax=Bifidobacterium sp. ESL0690 TaxID=2983214 RepID=UPI0023F9B9DA|nr:cytosine permease [Bifidobacterium sp. ESL0690]WEV45913.1 cytosine permease [Bifidobacterium sp. ESL0690]